MIEVDEFKFSQIISSVLKKAIQPFKDHKYAAKTTDFDDSCSLSDEDEYDNETTELSHNANSDMMIQ